MLLSLHCWPSPSSPLPPPRPSFLLFPLPSSFLLLPPLSSSLLHLPPESGRASEPRLALPQGDVCSWKEQSRMPPSEGASPPLALLGHKRCKGCPDLPTGHVDHMESQGEGGREHGADRWACEWAPEFPLCLGRQPLSRSTPTLISCQLTPTPSSAVASAAPRARSVERLWDSLGLSQKG